MNYRLSRRPRLRVEPLERREMLSVGVPGLWGAASGYVADDYGDTLVQAAQVNLSAAGSANQAGKIEVAGDADVFQFVAPFSGQMTIRDVAAAGSRLDTTLSVYDARQRLLAQNDDDGASRNSRIQINVTAGTRYYVVAAGYGFSTGAYAVQWSCAAAPTDDYGNTRADASTVALSAAGAGRQSGKIEQAGDGDVFRWVAPVTGTMTIRQAATSGSRLDSYLGLYDVEGRPLATNDDHGISQDSQLEFAVTAGTTYFVRAAGFEQSTGDYTVTFSTVASSPSSNPGTGSGTTPVAGGFQIDVTMTGLTASQQAVVQQAVDRWEQIIVGDLPNVAYRGQVIDDVKIDIRGVRIDGTGNVLGQASATAFRDDSGLPYGGFIEMDTSDIAAMQSNGSLLGVFEHEIAHVLGFGVIWADKGLLGGSRTSAPGFTGANAVAAYNAMFGTTATAVPVEADGGSGTALAHWDEAVFGNELMTGWYNSGQTNPLSRVTVASMADLGYQVNLAAADTYRASASSSSAVASVSSGSYAAAVLGVLESTSPHNRRTAQTAAVDLLMTSGRM